MWTNGNLNIVNNTDFVGNFNPVMIGFFAAQTIVGLEHSAVSVIAMPIREMAD